MQAAPACEVHAFRSARAVLTVGSRRADIGAAQLRARRGAVVSVAVQRRIPSPCVPFCPMFHVKHLCWRAERYGRERFGTGSSNRKSRQQQIGRPVQVFRLRGISHHSRPGVCSRRFATPSRSFPMPNVKRLVRKPVLANGLPRSRKNLQNQPENQRWRNVCSRVTLDLGADEVEQTRLLHPACASCLHVRAAKFCRYAEIAWGARRSCGCKLYTGWQRSTSI